MNLLKPKTCSHDVRGCLGAMFDNLLNKLFIDMKKARNGVFDRSQKHGTELIQDFWSQGVVVAALGAVWVSES